jgi:hypothetical protein
MAESPRRRSYPQRLGAVIAGIIDPKLTVYRGVTMRSRLEADFAAHLDERGIAWRYEPAVFGPIGRGYLPDFELRRLDGHHYVEVKPLLRDVPKAKERMAIILDTYPDAVLVVACAEASRWFASVAGGEWTTWVDRWAHG